jgi:hypothetical protein
MLGICSQWAIEQSFTGNELKVYLTIARYSFGYKHRWCYLEYSQFEMSKATVSKIITSLVERKIISKTWTFKKDGNRSKNEYKILEPKMEIKNFVFSSKEKQKIKIEEENWDE